MSMIDDSTPTWRQHCNADGLSWMECTQCGFHFEEQEPLEQLLLVAPEESWLPYWNEKELLKYQQQDPDLSRASEMTTQHTWPTTAPLSSSHTLQSLWAQREHLVISLLYRQWVDALGGGENPCLQLVLPRVLVSQVLK